MSKNFEEQLHKLYEPITSSVFIEVFGDVRWNNGIHFEVVLEGDSDVWLQTVGAEDDRHGTSCRLMNVKLRQDAENLKRMLSSVSSDAECDT